MSTRKKAPRFPGARDRLDTNDSTSADGSTRSSELIEAASAYAIALALTVAAYAIGQWIGGAL